MTFMIVVVLPGLALISSTTAVLPIHATRLFTGPVKDKSSQVFCTAWVIHHHAYPFTPPLQCCHDGELIFLTGGLCAPTLTSGGRGGLPCRGQKYLRTFVLLPSAIAFPNVHFGRQPILRTFVFLRSAVTFATVISNGLL